MSVRLCHHQPTICQQERKKGRKKGIKRVLNVHGEVKLNERRFGDETKIFKIKFGTNVLQEFLETCREAVLHLLRGTHYRTKASESGNHRFMWKKRIEILEGRKFPNVLDPYGALESAQSIQWTIHQRRIERDTYGDLMNQYNRQACEEFFAFFNYEREENEVDLHGLLVADEQYAHLRKNLIHKKLSDLTIEKVICRSRWEGDEAIRKLEEKLDTFDFDTSKKNEQRWIEIVVGAGNYSREDQKTRSKVERFL